MVRIKVLDWGPDHVPARLWFDVSLAVASPLIEEALGREGGIHLSIPLYLVAQASIAGKHIFGVLISEPRGVVGDRRVASVWCEGSEARGWEVGSCCCLCAVVGAVGVECAELGEGERRED